MAPKSKGSKNKEEWVECGQTGLRYHVSDGAAHQTYLEQRQDNTNLDLHLVSFPCIHKDTFRSRVQCSGKKLAVSSSPADKSCSLYLPVQVARLCGLGFGCDVEVSCQHFSLILRAYTHNVSQNNNILVDPESLLLQKLKSSVLDQSVAVTKFRRDVRTAKNVNVELHSENHNELENKQVLEKLHSFLLNKIVIDGSNFPFHYFGKFYDVKLHCADEFIKKDGNSLSDQISNLSLDPLDKRTRPRPGAYFTVTTSSILNILKKDSDTPSETKFMKVGGLDRQLKFLTDSCRQVFSDTTARCVNGVLVFGPPGVGKTLLAHNLCQSVSCTSSRVISGAEIYSKFYGETEAKIREVFESVQLMCPSVLVLEDVDTLATNKDGAGPSDQERRVLSTLQTCLDRLRQNQSKVFVLATTSKLESVPGTLRRPGRLDTELEITVPDVQARQQILDLYLQEGGHSLSSDEVLKVAKETHGFVGADIANLYATSLSLAAKEGHDLAACHLERARSQVKPSAMREVQVEVPSVTWQDIGGLHDLKLKLNQSVEWPTKRPEVFTRMGIKPPRGILMYGPPGCSKTMIAKALANESGLNFLTIKGPELFSKWVGESEKAVRDLFRRARNVAPSIVFFDEIDALGASRGGSGSSRVAERVLAQLLTEMDGVDSLVGVTVVAATNRPDMMDPALLRPGRLDRVVYVPLPDLETRKQVLNITTRNIPLRDVDLEEIAVKTDGYSGAEVCAVCNEAALAALEDAEEAEAVYMNHFVKAINIVKPRIRQELLQIYADFQSKHDS